MLNLPRLARLAETGEFDRLINDVARNGRPLPLGVRLRLSEAGSLPAAALGLALQRVVQLTYRPNHVSCLLVRLLLAQRDQAGAFGGHASTAVALAALFAFADQVATLPGGRDPAAAGPSAPIDPALHTEIHRAIAGALHALHAAQNPGVVGGVAARRGGLFQSSGGLIGDELDSAIVLWQLGLEPRFAAAVRLEDLLTAAFSRGMHHDRTAGPLLDRLSHQGAPRGDQPRHKKRSAA